MSGIDTVKSALLSFSHGFSTRNGGVSEGIFASLNLGMNRGDAEAKVKENYARFLASCGISQKKFVCGKQIHGNTVLRVGAEQAKEAYGYKELTEADGYITTEAGVPLVIFIADCIPLLLADEVNKVIAAAHCGWRGTVKNIQGIAVKEMCRAGADVSVIRAAIGPAIGRCCFEVGAEVIEGVQELLGKEAESLYDKKENGKYMLDLKAVVKTSLEQNGLSPAHIGTVPDCTMCMPEKYWSHRHTGGIRGSQAAVIMIPDHIREKE